MFFINSTVYLIIVAFSFVLISGLLIFVWKYTGRVEQQAAARQAQGANNNNVDNVRGEESSGEEEEDDNRANRAARRRPAGGLGRMNVRRRNVGQQEPTPDANAANNNVNNDVEETDSGDEGDTAPGADGLKLKKVGKKKALKLQMKEERAQMRQQQDELKKQRLEREEQERKEREEKERLEDEEERKREEELERIRLEKEKKEEEDYQSWKQFISVEGTGSESQERMSDEELAKQLIEYVTEEKVSFLEDLASKFNLKTQDVITKINQLEQEGRLTGVIDDRGKFIFITPQELQNVANFINLRGRVSIEEIVRESNKLIDLNTKNRSNEAEAEPEQEQ
jgi:hypothetical protein